MGKIIKIEGCAAFIIVIVIGIITVFISYMTLIGFLYLIGRLPNNQPIKQETVIHHKSSTEDTCNAAFVDNWGFLEEPE